MEVVRVEDNLTRIAVSPFQLQIDIAFYLLPWKKFLFYFLILFQVLKNFTYLELQLNVFSSSIMVSLKILDI